MEEGNLWVIFMFKFSYGVFLGLFSSGAIAAVATSCAPPECLDYASGAYAGIGLGYQSSMLRARPQKTDPFFIGNWKADKNAQYPEMREVSTSRSSMQGMVGDLNLGWDARFRSSHIVLGFIMGFQSRGGSGQISYPVVLISPSLSDPGVSNISAITRGIKVSSPWGGYGAFRFGVAVGRALIYAKLGFSYNYLKSTARAPDREAKAIPTVDAKETIVMNSNRWTPSFLGGVGIDFRISRSVVFFSSFDVNVGSKTKLTFTNPKAANKEVVIPIKDDQGKASTYTYIEDPKVTTISVRPILFVGMVGLRYFFPNR
jgi:hypothetical protein